MGSPDSTTITDAQGLSWVSKKIEWARKNWFLLVLGFGAYSAGGGSGSLLTAHTGSSSLRGHVDSLAGVIMITQARTESKVDRVLVGMKFMQGVILEVPGGPGALKRYRKKQQERGVDQWEMSTLRDTAYIAAKGEKP